MLLMFFIKPSFIVSDSDNNEKDNVVHELKSTGLTQNNTQLEASHKKNIGCDEDCILSVIARLKTGQDLKNEYGPSMHDIEALITAQYLEDKPELISEIEASLATIEDQSKRNSFVMVFNNLPADQVIEIAKRLIASDVTKAKVDGLNMLYNVSKQEVDIKQPLESFIENDKDIGAVFAAIKILSKTHPDEFEAITRERLNGVMSDPSNERNQARALIIKVQLFTTNDTIKADISNGLKSKSERIQAKSINALDHVLGNQRDARDPSRDWRKDNNLKAIIDGIANDGDAALRNRREMIDILIRYF